MSILILLIILDSCFILISCIINFLFDLFNFIFTFIRRMYRYRLLITRTNNYFITNFCLFLINFCLFLIGIVINSLVYSCIIVFNRTILLASNLYWVYWILYVSWSLTSHLVICLAVSSLRKYDRISVYNSGRSTHKIQRGPQQYTCCTYTQFTNTKSLLNSSNNSISHSSLFLSILDYSHSLFFSAYLLKNNKNIFQ